MNKKQFKQHIGIGLIFWGLATLTVYSVTGSTPVAIVMILAFIGMAYTDYYTLYNPD